MGCTGIGLTRTLQTVVLNRAYAGGIAWPPAIAPFDVVIVQPGGDGNDASPFINLYYRIIADGFRTLLDDRNMPLAPRKKLLDLIHAPAVIELADGGKSGECKLHIDGLTRVVKFDEVIDHVRRVLRPWP
jgi:prolyl-tRNA synthetase